MSQPNRRWCLVASLSSLALLACGGGGGGGGGEVDASGGPDAASPVDAAGPGFRVVTHTPASGMARASLVAVRDNGGAWAMVAEATPGEYAGAASGPAFDVAVVCESYSDYHDVFVTFFHLTTSDPSVILAPCAPTTTPVSVNATVNPAAKLYLPTSIRATAATSHTTTERPGVGDVVAVSATRAMISHDVPFAGPTSLTMDLDTGGATIGDLQVTLVGAGTDMTVVRSSVVTRNGTIAPAATGAAKLFPAAQLASGDVREIWATSAAAPRRRRVELYRNDDAAYTLTFPPALGTPTFERTHGRYTWTDVVGDAREVSLTAATIAGTIWTSWEARISVRRLGLEPAGEYTFPVVTAIPGWDAPWSLANGSTPWTMSLRGSSLDNGFGAAAVVGESRWSTTIGGSAP